MIILVTKDLFFVPVVKSAAANHGVDVVVASGLSEKRLIDVDGSTVIACVVDLGAVAIGTLEEMVSEMRTLYPTASLAAFGPHVQEQRLQAAQDANFDIVLSRGQLDRQIAQLIAGWR